MWYSQAAEKKRREEHEAMLEQFEEIVSTFQRIAPHEIGEVFFDTFCFFIEKICEAVVEDALEPVREELKDLNYRLDLEAE